jgi:hypothetical protein
MESAWSNGKPAYRCRHRRTTASVPDRSRPRNAHIREELITPHLAALHLLLTESAGAPRRRRTRRGADVRRTATDDVICYLREQQIVLTYDPAAKTLRAERPSRQADQDPRVRNRRKSRHETPVAWRQRKHAPGGQSAISGNGRKWGTTVSEDFNLETSEVCPDLSLNSKTGKEFPDRVHGV